MMLMALYTGMRKGEIFKLRWSNIDFNRGFITRGDPKNGTDQRIPLNNSARSVSERQPKKVNIFFSAERTVRQKKYASPFAVSA